MGKKKNKESFFWTSYSDLMTSLFFIMLVLFVLIVIVLHNRANQIQDVLDERNADEEMVKKIETLQKQFKKLQDCGEFKYLESSQKFVAKNLEGEIFQPYKDEIKSEYVGPAVRAGKEIQNLLKDLHNDYSEFKYQLVIEGNVANTEDEVWDKDRADYYNLSYRRALALYQLWQKNGINLRQYNTEILICGSGLNGIDRDPVWYKNKRFTIQILPKIKPPKQFESKK